MLRTEKKKFVSDLEKIYQVSNSLIITRYHGLTVSDITTLRLSLKEFGASFKVVKNTLSKIAASNVNLEHNSHMFSGPTAIAYSEDPIAAAKGVVAFAKNNDNLQIVCGIINNQILDISSVHQLAALPSLDQLRGHIVGILQASASNIARVTQAPAIALARVVYAYANKINNQ